MQFGMPTLIENRTLADNIALCRRLGLGERVEANIAQLWKALQADRDTLIVELAGLHRRRALRALEQWTEEYAR